MSKLDIFYTDNVQETINVVGVDISVSNKFLILKKTDTRRDCIPLCNIRKICIDGVHKKINDE